jgi:hypothetical protein
MVNWLLKTVVSWTAKLKFSNYCYYKWEIVFFVLYTKRFFYYKQSSLLHIAD